MKRIKLIIISLVCVVTVFNINAQTNSNEVEKKDTAIVLKDGSLEGNGQGGIKELSLQDAIDKALKNNLSLKNSEIDQQSKKWSVISLFNAYYPSLSLTGSMIGSIKSDDKLKGSMTVPMNEQVPGLYSDIAKVDYDIPRWNAAMNFNLQWNFNAAMIFNSYNTVLDYQTGKISLEDAKASLIKNVKSFYYLIVLNKQDFEIEKNKLASKKDRYEQAQVKYRNGMTPKLDVLSSQVDYEGYKPKLSSLGNTIVYYLNMLQYFIGEPLDRDVVLTDTFIVEDKVTPDFDYAVDLFEKNNLTLKTMYLSQKQVNNAMNIYIAQLTPSFSLGLGITPTVTDAGKNWFEDSNWADRGNGVSLSISLPLDKWLPLSSTQVGIVGSNYAKKKMNLQIKNYIESQKVSIRQKIDDIRTALENIDSMKLSVDMARESYDETVKAYNLGTRELLDVRDAESTLYQMEYQHLLTEYTYRNSLLDLEYLLNTDLETILKTE